MAKINLKINTKIEVVTKDVNYKSVIQDVRDGFMYISIPISSSRYLPLEVGEIIKLSYFIENIGFFNCDSKVLRKTSENNIPMYIVTIPNYEVRIQRRNFVRVSTLENILYKLVEGDLKDKSKNKWNKCLMIDLSGGGMKIKVNECLKLGDKIKINFYNENEKIEINGEITRQDDIEGLSKNEIVCGVKFEEMNEFKRDKIIKKVFKIMLKQRRMV